MTRYRVRTVQVHEDRMLRVARAAFVFLRGEAEAVERQRQIEALPLVDWKGRALRTIRCNGETGKGPHLQHVPERILWALIDLRAYRCAFHF